MVDTDVQPSLSSYYKTSYDAPGGIYEFIINRTIVPEVVISHTDILNLDLIKSNDQSGKISLLLKDSDDGVIRFSHLLRQIKDYDLIVVDTRGTRDITRYNLITSFTFSRKLIAKICNREWRCLGKRRM